jgi:SAM-dependent methyltransferase
MNWHRAIQVVAGLGEHAVADLVRLAGARYFDGAHFDRIYGRPDPWGFATSPYEAARRKAVLAALPRGRYRSVLEVGCGEGHMTRLLAERAGRVVGLEISPAAVALARISSPPENVMLVRGDLLGAPPPEAPPGAFDLVVCAEVLYYCYRLPAGPACRLVRDRLVGWLAPGGDLVLQHPRHYPAHAPFDRLAERGDRRRGDGDGRTLAPALVPVERRYVPLTPRPFTIAVYRRPHDAPADGARGSPARGPTAFAAGPVASSVQCEITGESDDRD